MEEVSHVRIEVPEEEALGGFCRRHHIRSLSLFGSVLREDFGAESDVDVLVEFEPDRIPGLEFVRMKEELSELFGRRVDLNTPKSLSPYFREEVLQEAERVYGPS